MSSRINKWVGAALLAVFALGATGQTSFRYRRAVDDPLGRQKSRVLEVRDGYVVRGTLVDDLMLKRMLNTGIMELSGAAEPSAGWRRYLHEQDKIALVFNRRTNMELGTNSTLAGAMLEALYEAGFRPEQFVLVGLDERPPQAEGTISWQYGWQAETTDYGSDSDYLARWLGEVTAIVNVPSFMDDNVIGLRGALANATLPVLKSPARPQHIHAGGDPFIAEIYDLPQIQGKIRLTIANALHVLYYGGPEVDKRYVVERGAILFADDPVALDRIGEEILKLYRRTMTMPDDIESDLHVGYLRTAEAMGLGYYNLDAIDYRTLKPLKSLLDDIPLPPEKEANTTTPPAEQIDPNSP